MNQIYFSPSDQYEFQAKNAYTKELLKKFALQHALEDILLYIFNNFHILYEEETKLTLWESVDFYKNYLKYRENMRDTIEKELYFNFINKKFSRKGFYINIVTRINCFKENSIFFYIGNDFTYGLNLEKNIYYKFNFDKELNIIKLKEIRGIFYNNTIVLPYKEQINTEEIEIFQIWSKKKYNQKHFQEFKKEEKKNYYVKIFGLILMFIVIVLLCIGFFS